MQDVMEDSRQGLMSQRRKGLRNLEDVGKEEDTYRGKAPSRWFRYFGVESGSDVKYLATTSCIFFLVVTLISLPVIASNYPYEIGLEVGMVKGPTVSFKASMDSLFPAVYAAENPPSNATKTYSANMMVGDVAMNVKVKTVNLSESIPNFPPIPRMMGTYPH